MIERRWAKTSSARFNAWLRKKGCTVGQGVRWFGLNNIFVDVTRPSLLEIGDNVCITSGCVILTHGYDWFVLKNLYHELLASSGGVCIKNNVFVGTGSVILKGVTIGDNCIIGACSLVNHDIPSDSVFAGNPAKFICTIEDYYNKRKQLYVDEARAYARSIKKNLHRRPRIDDFWEEFPLFLNRDQRLAGNMMEKQLGEAYAHYKNQHTPLYDGFDSFLKDAGL
ncbi:MAG: acyltransferase [Deltaproteobacteria bacterium]|nr:acyltransferase [Deltaproteobacteria bacterium]